MCGICGIVSSEPRADREHRVRRMCDTLKHRGPDDEGMYSDDSVTLGFRRLSIIDPALGRQPMPNEDETVWVVFNGEIYNYRELRETLRGRHRFRTNSDTEVIVHLFEEKGIECLHDLRGMFAMAIWDGRDRTLWLARDRLGKKPLVYLLEPGRLVFASELKALLADPVMPRRVSREAFEYYLAYLYVPAPMSILQGVSKLPPAHYLCYRDGRAVVRRYWDPPLGGDPPARDEIRGTIEEAVRLRLVSDVPLGAFLSGGIDSTLVVGLMSRYGRAKTFSIGFSEEGFDELEYARAAAEAFGTEHREFEVRPDATVVLPKLVWHYDEPLGDSSALPTYYVSKATSEHVKVALSGDGGDECFGGYPRYGQLAHRPLLAPPPAERYRGYVVTFSDRQRHELLGTTDPRVARLILEPFDRFAGADPVARAGYTDLQTYLPFDILTKVDIASMANSLEVRCPFLDHKVVEMALRLPGSAKRDKRVLRETFADLLPPKIAGRGKMGFGLPLTRWLRNELRSLLSDTLLGANSALEGFVRMEVVRRMVQEHWCGAADHADRLWALLFFELWHRTWIG